MSEIVNVHTCSIQSIYIPDGATHFSGSDILNAESFYRTEIILKKTTYFAWDNLLEEWYMIEAFSNTVKPIPFADNLRVTV